MRGPLLLAMTAALVAGAAAAQEVHLQLSEPPYFVGEPLDVQLVVEGFAREPQPEVSFEPPRAGSLELLGMSPNVRQSISMVSGKVTRQESVQFVYRYRLLVREAGTHRIGPFSVRQGAQSASSPAREVQVAMVPRTDEVHLRLVLPETPVYPGQRVALQIEWSFAAQLRERLHRYRIRSPLFDRGDSFRFLDPPAKSGETELVIETASGQIALPAEIRTQQIGGLDFLVVTAERTLVPLRTGTFEFEPASVVVDVVTSWRRDFLGGRVPQRVRKRRAQDLPRKLVVREIPLQGRPAGFAGAVGRGFTLEVTADRSVVQVADPIELTFVLRGDGNLESAGLPQLSAEVGLSPLEFRLPSGDVEGVVEDRAKTFRVSVRALAESVQEIPALRYAYFDPVAGEFRSTRSRPIALSVRPADLVTARDVVSAEPGGTPPEGAAGGTARDGRLAPAMSLTGANFAIVREPELLLRGPRAAVGSGWLTALYVGSLGLIVLAVVLRRRADLDPELVGRRKALRHERRRIAAAEGLPRSRGVETIAEALRAMVRVSAGPRPDQLDQFVAECDALIFSPDGGGGEPLDPAFRRRALELADALLEGPG